jgi:hypothetical protein
MLQGHVFIFLYTQHSDSNITIKNHNILTEKWILRDASSVGTSQPFGTTDKSNLIKIIQYNNHYFSSLLQTHAMKIVFDWNIHPQ